VLGLTAIALTVAPVAEPSKALAAQKIIAKYGVKAPNVLMMAFSAFTAATDES
jgi:hypothetical protein